MRNTENIKYSFSEPFPKIIICPRIIVLLSHDKNKSFYNEPRDKKNAQLLGGEKEKSAGGNNREKRGEMERVKGGGGEREQRALVLY